MGGEAPEDRDRANQSKTMRQYCRPTSILASLEAATAFC
jgi:hypothetical protein